jgi:hypothetical protein
VFLLAELHSVLQTVRDPIHLPVILFGMAAGIIGLGVGIWCNFFYNKVFSSTVICVSTPLAGIAYFFSMMFKADFSQQALRMGFKPQLWLALAALWVAIMVLTAIAVAASTRLGQVMTLCVTILVFLLGLLSDWIFGRQLASLEQAWTQRAQSVSPSDLERVLSANQLPTMRQWAFEIRSTQVVHEFWLWPCRAKQRLFELRSKLNEMSKENRVTESAAIEREISSNAATRLNEMQTAARQAADAIEWPPKRSDVILGKRVEVFPPLKIAMATGGEATLHVVCRIAYSIVPNFQVLWLSDALTQSHIIPVRYVLMTAVYGAFDILAALSLATILFQRREVG